MLSCGQQALRVAGQTRHTSHPLCTSPELPLFSTATSSWARTAPGPQGSGQVWVTPLTHREAQLALFTQAGVAEAGNRYKV